MIDLQFLAIDLGPAVRARIDYHDVGDGTAKRGHDENGLVTADNGECWNDSVDPLFVVTEWVAINVLWSSRELQEADSVTVGDWWFDSDGDDEFPSAGVGPDGTSIGEKRTAVGAEQPRQRTQ